MKQFPLVCVAGLVVASFASDSARALEPARPINGSLVIVGGGTMPEAATKAFVELAGGKEKARLVVIPTASQAADGEDAEKTLGFWKQQGIEDPSLLHTRDRAKADSDQFVAPLKTATAVWIGGGSQELVTKAYRGTAVERELHALLTRGGVIGGTSAGAAVMSKVMITGGNPQAQVATGFGFLTGAVIDQHWLRRNRMNRLLGVLQDHPGTFGLGIDEGTALLVRGRQMRVIGESYVTCCLLGNQQRPPRFEVWHDGDRADLVTWSRAAIARTQPAFPPENVASTDTGKGTLVIVGGGGMPKDVTATFLESAGGPDASIVVVPGALGAEIGDDDQVGDVRFLRRAGAKNVSVFHPDSPDDLAKPEFLAPLKKANGVWFSGGRQWRLVDLYDGTPVVELFRDVLRRGGVIGGSSAGASIQAEYLVRGNPLGNFEMMTEGYERGFGFLQGAAVDQHFTQRNRFADMTALMTAHPQLLGLGIDEATAVIVRGHEFRVMGKNRVQVYNWRDGQPTGDKDHIVLKPGQQFDLKTRKVVEGE